MGIWKTRIRATAIHLIASFLVCLLAATLVFFIWYPYPYSKLSGGTNLFQLLTVVDMLLGPLLTLVIFDSAKPRSELRRDVGCVVVLQLAALSYGLWTVAVARPVYLVFEMDRFRVVHAIDVPEELLPKAPSGFRTLPVFTQGQLAVRRFSSVAEGFDATMAALQGLDLAARPDLWQPYADSAAQIHRVGKPVVALKKRFPEEAKLIDDAVASSGRSADNLISLPVVGRQAFWTAFLDKETLEVKSFLPLDSF